MKPYLTGDVKIDIFEEKHVKLSVPVDKKHMYRVMFMQLVGVARSLY